MPIRITYLLLTFPKLTTTFVDREIQSLHQKGIDVRVISLRRPTGPLSHYQEALKQQTTYLYPAKWRTLLAAHIYYALRRPWGYFSTLFHLLTSPHPTFLSHRRTLRHFMQGIYTTYMLRKNPGDHIHAHFLNQSATIALIMSRLLDLPYSVTVHASGEFFASPMMVREKLAGAKFIATCTQYSCDCLADMGKDLFDDRLIVNYHGIDIELFHRRQARPSRQPVILAVGQLRERKGLIYLVRACGILHKRGVNFQCRIIGEGPERQSLEEEIKLLGLADNVELLGALPQEEIVEQYEKASLFAMPAVTAESGDQDGIPNVILEAMAMELPVVSTWSTAIPEVVRDQHNGLLVPQKDPAALADALALLLEDNPMAEQMGMAGRETVLAKFDPMRNIQMLVDAFMA